ncbi:ABC transporter permease [Nocardioides humi]|uniref:ABC transporter permease n=1 Tax=Nocardioides humi TaxID=449461 RepID=A0ABN2BU42_9ACTN|nr:ABC transporter permease [Nocardioides humi]
MMSRGVVASAPKTVAYDKKGIKMPRTRAKRRTRRKGKTRLARAPKLATGIVVLAVLVAVFGPMISSWNATETDLVARQLPPAWMDGGDPGHWFGTDRQGRDILVRVMVGARVSLTIAVLVILISGIVGTALGLIAGYKGGWVDAVITRVIDGMSAFPPVLVALAVAVTVGSSLWVVVGVLSLVLWSRYARLVRAETLSWKEREFVLAAIVTGCRPVRVVLRHVLPNLVSTVIVFSTLQVGYVILSEAALSFLGAGVPPPTPTWGGMIADGHNYIDTLWWMWVFPGIAIAGVIVSANLLGDWLRDEFDPRLRQV